MTIPANEALTAYPDTIAIDYSTKGDKSFVNRPDSSNIASLVFDHEERTLYVHFKNGGEYSYHPCAWETFEAIAIAQSAGQAFNHHIRKAPAGTYEVTKIDRPVLPGYQPAPELEPIGGEPSVITDDDLEDAGLIDSGAFGTPAIPVVLEPGDNILQEALERGRQLTPGGGVTIAGVPNRNPFYEGTHDGETELEAAERHLIYGGTDTEPQPWPEPILEHGDANPQEEGINALEEPGCSHLNLPPGFGPMVRCPDCNAIVARPFL